jgi:RNA polymerase sigma factor (sigma-70 family)
MSLDEDVVAAIYRDHGPALRRFVLSASGDPQLADDVVQETILRVWQQAPDITGSLRSYLFRTARNIMIDNYRKAQRRPRETSDRELADPADGAERVNELLNRVLMEEALLRLSAVPDAVALSAAAPAVTGREPSPSVAAVPAPAPAAAPRRMLEELSTRRRNVRRRWSAALAAVAAACLALGVLAAPLLNPPPKPDASYSVQASDGLQLTVGMVKKTWGTELAVDGRSLPVDGTFSLWVKDSDGVEDRACAWTATPSGKVRITGATPLQLSNIASVEMRNGQQQTMAVIAVPRG